MTHADLLPQRLYNQHVSSRPFDAPEQVVAWLGAVQAQEYPGAKWSLAQRMTRITDAAIDDAFAAGRILRTHVLRPTWHFVTPEDIRWMLALTGPRVLTTTASYFRRMGLDETTCARSSAVMAEALRGGRHLTRGELAAALQQAGLAPPKHDPIRLAFILMRAELDAVICSGPLRGRQFTYALLDDRVPRGRQLSREEAGAELARRYFTSHGPASIKDFVWWSGLTAADARAALEANASDLRADVVDGVTFWRRPGVRRAAAAGRAAILLPTYDECLVAYKTRGLDLTPANVRQLARGNGQTVVVDGRAIGTWRRQVKARSIVLEWSAFAPPSRSIVRAVELAAARYARFMGVPVELRRKRG